MDLLCELGQVTRIGVGCVFLCVSGFINTLSCVCIIGCICFYVENRWASSIKCALVRYLLHLEQELGYWVFVSDKHPLKAHAYQVNVLPFFVSYFQIFVFRNYVRFVFLEDQSEGMTSFCFWFDLVCFIGFCEWWFWNGVNLSTQNKMCWS